jgi:hypothetical protein
MGPEPFYLQAIGQFIWNFLLLEWQAVYIIVTLNNNDWTTARLEGTSGEIAKALNQSIEEKTTHLPSEYVDRLRSFARHYGADILERNGLAHAHPYTADSYGTQQLGGEDKNMILREWSLERLHETAERFAEHEREGNALKGYLLDKPS